MQRLLGSAGWIGFCLLAVFPAQAQPPAAAGAGTTAVYVKFGLPILGDEQVRPMFRVGCTSTRIGDEGLNNLRA